MEKPPYPPYLNPDLTPELAQDVSFFRKWGYLVVDNAITQTQIRSLRAALDKTFKRRGEQFIHQLLEEDKCFEFLLDNAAVFNRMQAILGTCVQLHSATARVTEPGQEDKTGTVTYLGPSIPTARPTAPCPVR